MTLIREILDAKGREYHFVRIDDTVLEALTLMAQKNVGAVLVMDGNRLAGIFTERHYARNVFLKGRTSPTTLVREVMEKSVLCVNSEQTVEACMALMSEKRVRHLPVLDHGKLSGIISIGDLVKSIIADREFTIGQLEHFIHG
jgi:CBS domain-containing protein